MRKLLLAILGIFAVIVIASLFQGPVSQDSNRAGSKSMIPEPAAPAPPLTPPSPELIKERHEADIKIKRQAQEEAKRLQEIAILARKNFAPQLEQLFLDKLSMDTSVTVSGKGNEILKIRGALMGRVMAYQLFNKGGLSDTCTALGFKKVIFENSIDHSSWYYTLD
ncbi:MAG: hypothetical protein WAK96_07425 [Desulfobaccales bacterium]